MANEGGSLGNLVQVYKFVVEDVIRNVKEDFLNEGVEPEVLDQLQELWLRKEDLTDAVNRPRKPQLDLIPTPSQSAPPAPSSHLHQEHSSPRLPPALIHQPLPPPSNVPHRSTGTQSQPSQESVIQQAPAREAQATPSAPLVAHGNQQPSAASIPSPQQQLQMLSQFHVAMPTLGQSQTPPTTSQGVQTATIQVPQVTGVSSGVSGATPTIPAGLMPQLVVNPAALQNQPVLLPMQTSQGTIMVPLSTVLAMQAVANQQQQQQQQQQQVHSTTNTAEATPTTSSNQSATVHQIDGLPPSPPTSLKGCGSGRGSSGCVRKYNTREPETPPTDCDIASTSGIPPGVLKQLLRQQRRRRRRGKKGGVPVEVIVQLDGPGGGGGGGGKGKSMGEGEKSSSEDDSEGYGDSSDEEEVDQLDDDPLGSGDDEPNSEDEEKDFDTEDTIACQWEKVYRVKTKWKFQLKDGIMRMGGFEYVFHKANGEAEW